MEFLLPEGAGHDSARHALEEHLSLRPGRIRRGTTVFYDTFDGRVHGAGLILRHENGALELLDSATGETVASVPAETPKRMFAADLPDPIRKRLAKAIEMRALTPVAKVRSHTQELAVLNEDEKTVARLAVSTHDGLHGRVTARALRGYDDELERVGALLRDTLGWAPATVPLVDEAIAADGGDPAGTSSKLDLQLDPEMPATAAARIVFARLLEVIDANLPDTIRDVDTEFLHDLRVAVRRTRSLQRQFKSVYPARLQHFRDEFKRLQRETGELRDLDVYLLDFPALKASLPERMRDDLEPLRAVLERHRERALRATRRALQDPRTGDALADWDAFTRDAPTSEVTVGELASERIAKVYRRMVKMGRAIDDDSPAQDLHELRKVGKELRYLLEFFASLYPAEVVKPFIKTLKGLQDQLGRFQDREVQANKLRELAPEVADPPALMAMGVLVDRFIAEEAAARAEFADRFGAFASKAQRAVVKEHFG